MPDRALPRIGTRDVLIAAACAVISVMLVLIAGLYLGEVDGVRLGVSQIGLAVAVVVTQSAVILARRISPVACFAVIAALQVAIFAAIPAGTGVRSATALVAAFTVGALLPIRRAGLVIVAVAVGETAGVATVMALTPPAADQSGAIVEYGVSTMINYIALLLLGAFVTARRQAADLIGQRAIEALREHGDRAARAVIDERSRMARELHDIAAHHLSGMVVQASAVERLIDRDPEAAKAATRALRTQGKETLANLRTAVGMLREHALPQGVLELADRGGPVPGVELLDELIAESVVAGDRVEFVSTGDPVPLAPLADVAVYRVVQEALSNARQHAPSAAARVRLEWAASELTVEVVNDRADSPVDSQRRDGLGLIGMRERAELIGADLATGPTAHGGWRVTLTLPLAAGDADR